MLLRSSPVRLAAFVATGLVVLLATASGGLAAQAASYHDFDALSAALRTLVDSSDAAQMSSLGMSIEGREIWLVQLAADGPAPIETRPAVLVVGNLEGDQVVEDRQGLVQHGSSGHGFTKSFRG